MTMYGMKRRDVKPVRSSRKPLCSDAVTVESDSEPHVNWSSRPVHLHNKPVLEEVAVVRTASYSGHFYCDAAVLVQQ